MTRVHQHEVGSSHRGLPTCPMAYDKRPKPRAAAKPAKLPSRLTAPSVPRGTRCRVVMRYVVLPYACTQAKPPPVLFATPGC